MRFELFKNNMMCNGRFILDIWDNYLGANIYAYKIEISWHPLSTAYYSLCENHRLQIAKTDMISQQSALILFASLVLL